MKKVGIFSGTFDPVHEGHLAFARQAIAEHDLDKVVFLVEKKPRRKHAASDYEQRLAMVELAVAGEPNMGTLTLDQPQFSVQSTLPLLEAEFKAARLYFLVGDDMVEHMAHWPDITKLLTSVTLAIAVRTSSSKAIKSSIAMLQNSLEQQVNYYMLENQSKAISSQAIRQAFQQQQPTHGLPKVIQRYIKTHKLYL